MKKTLSFLLAVLLLFGSVSVSLSAFGAKTVKPEKKYFDVFPNDSKSGELRLYFGTFSEDGIQVFRSETGERGSYKKIATVRTEPYCIDRGLKANTRYYYAIRSFIKTDDKTRFGPFFKNSGWTMPTVSYANKLLKKAYRVAAKWMQPGSDNVDFTHWIERKLPAGVDLPGNDGSPWQMFPVKDSSITSKKALKRYLHRYFASDRIDELVDAFYYEEKGKLYQIAFDWPLDHRPLPNEDEVIYVAAQWDVLTFVTIRKNEDDARGKCSKTVLHTGYFFGNRFIFTDDDWWMDLYIRNDQ